MLEKKVKTVVIEASDSALTTGYPHGEDVFRGLILHEIGHHLYDAGARGFKTMDGISRSEGVGEIFDFLIDERLERKLRSRRPEWGAYFDRLASYVFAEDEKLLPLEVYAALIQKDSRSILEGIKSGKLPGRMVCSKKSKEVAHVSLSGKDYLSIPGFLPPSMLFLSCLRCGFDPGMCPDPKVRAAVRLVPRNLKSLPHSEVLKVARKIGDLIGGSHRHKNDLDDLKERLSHLGETVSNLRKLLEKLCTLAKIPDSTITENTEGERVDCRSPYLHGINSEFPPGAYPKYLEGILHRGVSKQINMEPGFEFGFLTKMEAVPFNPQKHLELVVPILRHIRVLRAYFGQLSAREVEEYGSRRGRRFDMAQVKKAALAMTPNLLVHSRDEINPNAYIGILIDRSGSMEGEGIELARKFGALIAESGKGLRGLQGHVSAFDDDTFYMLGDFQRNAIASLEAGGGNNDSGALMKAAELALQSRKRNKLLVMISDGSPAQCTFESLKNLVRRLTLEKGIICAQVAVEEMEEIAFPHFVDLSLYPTDEAVARFGRLLIKLTTLWR